MRLDGAVRRRVRNAREHEAVAHLVVVKERLVGLVNGTSLRIRKPRARDVSQDKLSLARDKPYSHTSGIERWA